MSVILQSDLPYPACLRDDLVCGDHIDPHTVAMVADSVNVRNKVIPCIEVSNTDMFIGKGDSYHDFMLADGAPNLSLTVEFCLSQTVGQQIFGVSPFGRTGVLTFWIGVYSAPNTLQYLFSFYYNKAEYSTVTGTAVSSINTKEVGGDYRIETINKTINSSFFTQGQAVPAFIRASLNYPYSGSTLLLGTTIHPITNQVFTNSGIYGLSVIQQA